MAQRTWVLGGGGARGAAQVGVLLGLFEAGVEPPSALVGASVGALNAAGIAAYPTLGGAQLLHQIWLSDLARGVFQAHPVGIIWSRLRGRRVSALPAANVYKLLRRQEELTGFTTFEQLALPLTVVATDIGLGAPALFKAGPLLPALQASTAIPGIFPGVDINGREFLDGGIVQNTPFPVAFAAGAREVLAISLMAGGELESAPLNWGVLMARTLQLALHHHMLSDYERLKDSGRLVVLCPVSAPTEGWEMGKAHVDAVIESARQATLDLLSRRGSRLFRHSGIHYLHLH